MLSYGVEEVEAIARRRLPPVLRADFDEPDVTVPVSQGAGYVLPNSYLALGVFGLELSELGRELRGKSRLWPKLDPFDPVHKAIC